MEKQILYITIFLLILSNIILILITLKIKQIINELNSKLIKQIEENNNKFNELNTKLNELHSKLIKQIEENNEKIENIKKLLFEFFTEEELEKWK
jgi:predicted PurR-regulated permease PerM